MELGTALRLGRWARGSGPRALLARRWLLGAGDRGEQRAIDQLWDLWLDAPDGVLWSALSRWRRQQTGGGLSLVALGKNAPTTHVVEAAGRAGHPVAAIARAQILAGPQNVVDAVCEAALTDEGLAAFCREHQLAPADPHRAAVYFLVTGQDDQYHVADPDHSLLAVAYQGAGEAERARIRARAGGRPDLVRALADTVRRGGLTRLAEREAEYLVDAFSGRRDWAGLWALVKELPVVDAAAAARRFDGWRPQGPDAGLFDTLAAVDPAELAAAHRAVAKPTPIHLPVLGMHGGSISPDGRRIVVNSSSAVDVFTLPDGVTPRHEVHRRMPHNAEVLALNDAVVVSHWERFGGGPWPAGIHPVPRAAAFDRLTNGFAALIYDEGARTLRLLSGTGQEVAAYERRDLALRTTLGLPAKIANDMRTFATEPASGLVAFAGRGLFLARLTGGGLEPLAYRPFSASSRSTLAFSGPDRLITMDDDRELRVWRPDGDELHLVAERKVAGAGPVDLPSAGVIVMQDMSGVGAGTRQLRYVAADTLADVPLRDRFNRPKDTFGVFAAPDGTRLGVCYWDGVEIAEIGFTELAHRPLAATTPADLLAVRTRLTRDPANTFLTLLRACLEHRFGTDVALGNRPVSLPSDGIALGGPS